MVSHWRVRAVRTWGSNLGYFAASRFRRWLWRQVFGQGNHGFCLCGAFVTWNAHKNHVCGVNHQRRISELERVIGEHETRFSRNNARCQDNLAWQQAAGQRAASAESVINELRGRVSRLEKATDNGSGTVVGRLNGLSNRLNTLEETMAELSQRLWTLVEVEGGHAAAYVDRFKILREKVNNLSAAVSEMHVENAVAQLGTAPAKKVDQLAHRYKLVRSYVRGVSERMRVLERAAGISPTLDGPQRFKEQACELLIEILEGCSEFIPPLYPTRIVHLLDASGYERWGEGKSDE